jgi:alkylation response protein AidB-like acyl-CoA dehydrogenase
MADLLEEAHTLTLVSEGCDDHLGVWEPFADGCGSFVSAQILRCLGRHDAGFALAAHRACLARWILRRLGVSSTGRGTAAVQGRFGLGRLSVARYLAGASLDPEDRAILADDYDVEQERLLTTETAFAWVVAPVVDATAGSLSWVLWPRGALSVRLRPSAHGFDNLGTMAFRPKADGAGAGYLLPGDADVARECAVGALHMEALALMAIGLGAAEQAHSMARAYASTRRQGGRRIEEHPAVQLLLASSRSAITTVEALVESAAGRPIDLEGLCAVLAARAEAHPLLCRATNDDLQVFGGSGYMRDTGIEKILRDQNHMRVTCGSPLDLALFVAELERLHG